MFTGLIEEIGKIISARPERGNLILDISASMLLPSMHIGDSININGACQTVIETGPDWFRVETVAESLQKTNLGNLEIGDLVNLELALRADGHLGGHIVTGHVDCAGRIVNIKSIPGSFEIEISYPSEFADLIVPKGSVAVNGVSLTVMDCNSETFKVAIIPHTWEKTILSDLRQGDLVNLEFDLIGKYVRQILRNHGQSSESVTQENLRRAGF